MNPILIDINWRNLLPLTFAKPLSHLLIGIDTIAEKWERHLNVVPGVLPPQYLREAFPANSDSEIIFINSAVIPTPSLAEAVTKLKPGQVLTHRGIFIAAPTGNNSLDDLAARIEKGESFSFSNFGQDEVFFNEPTVILESPADIFAQNDAILRQDFQEITKKFKTTNFPNHIITSGFDIFIHPEAKVHHCVLNATTGPIYIGKGAVIMEGSLVRGPFAIGESSTLKMGAKVYGATSIGKHCKVGGEVNNVVINDYSNKGHDGFLGNSVIGSWCNLGADTNTSNLKNNYGEIKVWNYETETLENTGRQFHGLIMGDHSKAGINTMFNTGTVVGMCANIFDGGFPPKFTPSFSWGGAQGFETFKIEKAFEASQAMMERRNVHFGKPEADIFRFVFEYDSKFKT
ncbi:glucose-1-phosphate thymidylyltransferase [Cryomorpha ignava]|uniref:Glucose-1-phosphate thymidylyltransferase n=1 Tax=Cryomorpha ignava TaxID=101383 RepID=A0A7K3WT67_9FLAO|nr:putative sugar nucleotidyl transferase [Cryomorpha ignava]NEN24684.1 glucose-1-phosphate thymidylyltransferase [Cryomorpha ignava]